MDEKYNPHSQAYIPSQQQEEQQSSNKSLSVWAWKVNYLFGAILGTDKNFISQLIENIVHDKKPMSYHSNITSNENVFL